MKGRIPVRFASILFGGILSAIMVSVVTVIVLLLTQGLTADFAARWLESRPEDVADRVSYRLGGRADRAQVGRLPHFGIVSRKRPRAVGGARASLA